MTQGKYVGSNLPVNMKDFLRINGDLFLKGAKGLLMMCVSRQEGLTMLHRLHYDIYVVNIDVSLYRRLQRRGSSSQKWPMMLKKNNRVVRLVLLSLWIKQMYLMANCWKKIDMIHT